MAPADSTRRRCSTGPAHSDECSSPATSDLLTEASRRLWDGQPLVGLVYAHQLHVTIGQCVRDLEPIATVGKPEDLAGRVHHIPFR